MVLLLLLGLTYQESDHRLIFFVCVLGDFSVAIYSAFIFLVEVLAMFEGEVGIKLCSVKVEVSFLSIRVVIIAPGSIPEAPWE